MVKCFFPAGKDLIIHQSLSVVLLLIITMGGVAVAADDASFSKNVGEKAPLFSTATSQDTLFDYNRDVYGRHHLILSFLPAAFTPV